MTKQGRESRILSGDPRYYSLLRKRATRSYDASTAESYRQSDEDYQAASGNTGKFAFVRAAARAFDREVRVLDLGCGTGRYFHCFNESALLIGVDVSRPMLEQARNPVGGTGARTSLVESSLYEIEFSAGEFDIVYCMGVFGSNCSFDDFIVGKVSRWLRSDGMFCFGVIERWLDQSPGTWRSRLAERVAPYLAGSLRAYVEAKLNRLAMDRGEVTQVAMAHFGELTLSTFLGGGGTRSDLLCIATKPPGHSKTEA